MPFICPECGHMQDDPGDCPECGATLEKEEDEEDQEKFPDEEPAPEEGDDY